MALYRYGISENGGGGGGGGTPVLEATTLWTNSAPTTAYGDNVVTLSDDITNYDYIGINYRPVGTSSSNPIMHLIYPVSDWITMSQSSWNGALMFASLQAGYYGRIAWYSSATQVHITQSFKMNGTGTQNASNVPAEIVGLKLAIQE